MEKFLKDNSNSNNSPVTSHSTNYFTENTDDKGNAGIKDNDEKMSGPIFDNLFSEEPKDINLYKYNPYINIYQLFNIFLCSICKQPLLIISYGYCQI